MEKYIAPYEWNLSYSAEKNKQYSQTIESVYFIMIILFFIFPAAAILFLVLIIILIGSMSKSDSSASGGGMVLEKYKIDMEGITVEDVRNQRSHQYQWNELASYCPYSVAKPFYGSFLKKYAGDDFILTRVGGSQIKIKAGRNDAAMVNSVLSKKLKVKNVLNSQGNRSFRMDPLKIGACNPGAMMIEKKNFDKPRSFSSGAEEKRFYEEKRYFERNYARASEQSFRNKVIGIYFILVIFSLIGYSVYHATKDAKVGSEMNGQGSDVSGINEKSDIAGSEYIVSCKADEDCQYYFFSTTDSPGAMSSIPKLTKVSDSNGCIWAVINRKYGLTWNKQYPAPRKCILSASIKNRKGCDPARKVCVAR